MGRVKNQGVATGEKAAAKRSQLSREKTVQLRALARLTRLATLLRAAEAESLALREVVKEALWALDHPGSDLGDALSRARGILRTNVASPASSTTPSSPAPTSTGATAASASSKARP